jgi:hypothetical protein
VNRRAWAPLPVWRRTPSSWPIGAAADPTCVLFANSWRAWRRLGSLLQRWVPIAAPGLPHHCGPGGASLACCSPVLLAHPLHGQARAAALRHSCAKQDVVPHTPTLGRPGRRGCYSTRRSPTCRARCGPSRQSHRRGPRAARAPGRATAARLASPAAPGPGKRTAQVRHATSQRPRMCAARARALRLAPRATRAAGRAAAGET